MSDLLWIPEWKGENILGSMGRKEVSVIRRRTIISIPRRAVCIVLISATQPVAPSEMVDKQVFNSPSAPVYLKRERVTFENVFLVHLYPRSQSSVVLRGHFVSKHRRFHFPGPVSFRFRGKGVKTVPEGQESNRPSGHDCESKFSEAGRALPWPKAGSMAASFSLDHSSVLIKLLI